MHRTAPHRTATQNHQSRWPMPARSALYVARRGKEKPPGDLEADGEPVCVPRPEALRAPAAPRAPSPRRHSSQETLRHGGCGSGMQRRWMAERVAAMERRSVGRRPPPGLAAPVAPCLFLTLSPLGPCKRANRPRTRVMGPAPCLDWPCASHHDAPCHSPSAASRQRPRQRPRRLDKACVSSLPSCLPGDFAGIDMLQCSQLVMRPPRGHDRAR